VTVDFVLVTLHHIQSRSFDDTTLNMIRAQISKVHWLLYNLGLWCGFSACLLIHTFTCVCRGLVFHVSSMTITYVYCCQGHYENATRHICKFIDIRDDGTWIYCIRIVTAVVLDSTGLCQIEESKGNSKLVTQDL